MQQSTETFWKDIQRPVVCQIFTRAYLFSHKVHKNNRDYNLMVDKYGRIFRNNN